PDLGALPLWRAQPQISTLYEIVRPFKGKHPIVLNGVRISGRKVVLGVWVVAAGEAVYVSAYDYKSVKTLEMTIGQGWWAELELPPLTMLSVPDLRGFVSYLIHGITLKLPDADIKGRVDMNKASLVFDPGLPPPSITSSLLRTTPRVGSEKVNWGEDILWRGMRCFGQQIMLIVCFCDVSTLLA
ncbi:unnamed protein product, partial [Choristocarpus tenellus]